MDAKDPVYRDLCGKCGAKRVDSQIGLEETPDAYVAKLVEVFREVKRLLRDDGTLWLNLGSSYAGSGKGRNADGSHQEGGKQGTSRGTIEGTLYGTDVPPGYKPKDLIMIPAMVAMALQQDGWWLRQEIIWHKKAPMPESVTDRCTKAHEQVFLLTKSAQYYFDADAIREPNSPTSQMGGRFVGDKKSEHTGNGHSGLKIEDNTWNGRNKRSVWTLGPESYSGAHFATMPTKLVEPCILAGSKPGDTVLDPFNGAATVGVVALKHHRKYIGCELNEDYINLSITRIEQSQPMLLGMFT